MLSSPDTPSGSPRLLTRQQILQCWQEKNTTMTNISPLLRNSTKKLSFLVLCPASVNLANSVKCMGDSHFYLSYARSLLCTPGFAGSSVEYNCIGTLAQNMATYSRMTNLRKRVFILSGHLSDRVPTRDILQRVVILQSIA